MASLSMRKDLPFRLKITLAFFGLSRSVTLLEFLNTPFGIDEFLGTGKEGVAAAANINFQHSLGRAGQDGIAANARGFDFLVFGVDTFTHGRDSPERPD
jgi:hypothetical protein